MISYLRYLGTFVPSKGIAADVPYQVPEGTKVTEGTFSGTFGMILYEGKGRYDHIIPLGTTVQVWYDITVLQVLYHTIPR